MSRLEPGEDLIATGADLEVPTLLEAYRSGYFPMPVSGRQIGWFSPDPRGVLLPGALKVSKSLRRSLARYSVTYNRAFKTVLAECADPSRAHGWIDSKIAKAYTAMNEAGYAHSIEVWNKSELAGGLYGLRIGGLFAGESMFHRHSDASKVALVHLCHAMGITGSDLCAHALIDVQWATPHLRSLGIEKVSRLTYGQLLNDALDQPERTWPHD